MATSRATSSYGPPPQLDAATREFLNQKCVAYKNGTLNTQQEEELPLVTTTPLVANVYIMTNLGRDYLKYELCPRENNRLPIPQTIPLLQKHIKELTLSEEELKQSISIPIRSDNPEFDALLTKVNGILPSCMFQGAVEGDKIRFRLCGRQVELILNQATAPAKSLPAPFQKRLAEVEYATYLADQPGANLDHYFYDILQGNEQNREITRNGQKASREELIALKKFTEADTSDQHTLYSSAFLQDDGKLVIDFDSYNNEVNYYIDHEKGLIFLTVFRKGLAEIFQNPEQKLIGSNCSFYSYEMIRLPKELFPLAQYPSITPPPHALLSNPTLTVTDKSRSRLTIDVTQA